MVQGEQAQEERVTFRLERPGHTLSSPHQADGESVAGSRGPSSGTMESGCVGTMESG